MLIVSHTKKFIFLHIPRSGGVAMSAALYPYNGGATSPEPDAQRLAWGPRYPHYTAQEVKDYVGSHRFQSYLKFGFVRNPWERLVSRYYHLRSQQGNNPETLLNPRGYYPPGKLTFIEWLLGRGESKNCLHALDLRPQADWLCDPQGKVLVDFVGRFERLDADFAAVCRRLAIKAKLTVENRQKPPGDYRGYFTPEAEAFVADRFRQDIELWGYAFGNR